MWRIALILALLSAAYGSNLTSAYVDRFISVQSSGLILVGTIDDLGHVPQMCKGAATQTVTFRVEQVLWGKWPGTTIPIAYGNCSFGPLPAPPFIKGARLIVFTRTSTSNERQPIWGGYDHGVIFSNPASHQYSSAELGLFPAIDRNMKTVLGFLRAQGFAESYVRRFVSPPSGQSGLIFVGTIEDLGKPQWACTVLLPRFVTFRIDRMLWGNWPQRTIQVRYAGRCGGMPLPFPPFAKGAQLIVLARAYQTGPGSEVTAFGGDSWDEKRALRRGLYPASEKNIQTVARIVSEAGLASSKH